MELVDEVTNIFDQKEGLPVQHVTFCLVSLQTAVSMLTLCLHQSDLNHLAPTMAAICQTHLKNIYFLVHDNYNHSYCCFLFLHKLKMLILVISISYYILLTFYV